MAVLFGGFKLKRMVSRSADALHLRHSVIPMVQKIVDNASIGTSRFQGECAKKLWPSGLLVAYARSRGWPVCLRNQVDRYRDLKKLRVRADVGRFQRQALSQFVLHSKIPLIRPRILQVLVNRRYRTEIDLCGREGSNGSNRVLLCLRSSASQVGIGIATTDRGPAQ